MRNNAGIIGSQAMEVLSADLAQHINHL